MKVSITTFALATLLGATITVAASAQQSPPDTEVGTSQLAMANLDASSPTTLRVTSPAFTNLGDIPLENTQYRGNIFPGLAWTAGPADTKSYVVIVQDGDALARGAPILHWTMVNIPPTITKLDAEMTAPPDGAEYGPNIRGPNHAYMGPHTPPGPKHRYHFQLFALNTSIPQSSADTYPKLVAAMKGHVLATGELIGLGHAPAPAEAR